MIKLKTALEKMPQDMDGAYFNSATQSQRGTLRDFYEGQGCWVASKHEIKLISKV